MDYCQIMDKLKSLENQKNREGMTRYGIKTDNAYGISLPVLRGMAREIPRNHELSVKLWKSGIHEARMLASFIGEPGKVTEKQMEEWVRGFDSWDICDQVCSNLFDKTPFAYKKAFEWSERKEEFVKRAGFVMMACLAVHDKKAPDSRLEQFFPVIKKHSIDERNFVKKAVNWALRQIGKRNISLNRKAIRVAKEIQRIDSKASRWIASDAIRELESEAVRKRLSKKRTL
jgi:3-methyladenine DNA glycosylase AlkD